ncbi:serine/threonine-protein phosphatase [Dehalococcoides mccartyi]|nr:serine/threonine-protein phosphatase [Dehalococcoides mccartyi]
MANSATQFVSLSSDESTAGSIGRISYAGSSSTGRVRATNQDSYGLAISDSSPVIFAVADGMGGHAGGDVASSTVISLLIESVNEINSENIKSSAQYLISQMNEELGRIQTKSLQYQGLGTTLSTIIIDGSDLWTVHIGDSRIYRLRNQALTQITKDHSWVQEQIDAGRLDEADALSHPRRNLITRVLGTAGNSVADITSYEIEIGDRYLLCSDGVHGVIPTAEILEALQIGELQQSTEMLMHRAEQAGSPDNVTVLIVDIG